MDRKNKRTYFQKPEIPPGQRSAFEMSLSLEHQDLECQVDAPPKEAAAPKAGEPCPACQSAKIDYDGMLNLSCTQCGYTLAGCFT